MTISEANNIVQDWGKHLEFVNAKLFGIFMSHIPESLLPYPIKTIEAAINVVAKYYFDQGDRTASDTVKNSY